MTGGRQGMSGNRRPGGFGPIVDGSVLPRHPFDPDAPAISKTKPLIVGYNRDETTFFLQREPAVFALTEDALKERLAKELEGKAETVYATYRKGAAERLAGGPLHRTFARSGRPAAEGQPAWPAYTTDRRATMDIDAQCRVVDDPYAAEREMWERLDG